MHLQYYNCVTDTDTQINNINLSLHKLSRTCTKLVSLVTDVTHSTSSLSRFTQFILTSFISQLFYHLPHFAYCGLVTVSVVPV